MQSTPSSAQASLHEQAMLQEATSTSGAAGPVAAGPQSIGADAAGPDAAGPDAAGPDAVGPDAEAVGPDAEAAGPDADTVGGAPCEESCNATEPDVADPVADVQSMGSCSTAKTEDAPRPAAARPRLPGLWLPWLTKQAGHRPEQVSFTCTPTDIHRMSFLGTCLLLPQMQALFIGHGVKMAC